MAEKRSIYSKSKTQRSWFSQHKMLSGGVTTGVVAIIILGKVFLPDTFANHTNNNSQARRTNIQKSANTSTNNNNTSTVHNVNSTSTTVYNTADKTLYTVNNALTPNYQTVYDKVPDSSLGSSVLNYTVLNTLGVSDVSDKKQIAWNGAGAFILNGFKTINLKTDYSSVPWIKLSQQDSQGRLTTSNDAWLNESSRQHENRETTGNGMTNWTPVGYLQQQIGGIYKYLYNHGHLIAYAIAGNMKGFDASEQNPRNIATQTAWANQASQNDPHNTGQNYYEWLVRMALDNG